MLNQVQFAGKIRDLEAGRLSVGDFEEWFREASRDVHLWGDEQLNEVVFSTEDIFSQYHFEDLDETKMKQGLANAIRPFVQDDWLVVRPSYIYFSG